MKKIKIDSRLHPHTSNDQWLYGGETSKETAQNKARYHALRRGGVAEYDRLYPFKRKSDLALAVEEHAFRADLRKELETPQPPEVLPAAATTAGEKAVAASGTILPVTHEETTPQVVNHLQEIA